MNEFSKDLFQLKPIGIVEEVGKQKHIRIFQEYSSGLYRLETISHIFILWFIHEADQEKFRKTKDTVIPRVRGFKAETQEMGTFSTRSPHRPNPIGLTLVKIIKIENDKIFVDFLDAFVGTPILDIKPYLPSGDRVDKNVFLPPWFSHLLISRLSDKSCE